MAKSYQEGPDDTFTHHGAEYRINNVFELAQHIKPVTVKMKGLLWNVKDQSELDASRLAKADTAYPLIAIREGGLIYVLDGNHRLRKLYDQGAAQTQVIFINQAILGVARLN